MAKKNKKQDDYMKLKSIDVLGTKYDVYYRTESEDAALETSLGYCDKYLKLIVVSDELRGESKSMGPQWELSHSALQKKVLRHELTHAFLVECGLDESTNGQWSNNEELVDFLALNATKLVDLFEKAGAI